MSMEWPYGDIAVQYQIMHSKQHITNILEPAPHIGLDKIDVPEGDKPPYPIGPDPKTWDRPWTAITNLEEIAAHVCAANVRQYNQATITPFGSGPLADRIGLHAEHKGADGLFNGSLPPPQVTSSLLPETKAVLRTLSTPLTLSEKDIQTDISPKDFIGTYKYSKESTSSSPSGRHIGHYKAVTDDQELINRHVSMMSLDFLQSGGRK
jgi:hypothetical protein